MKSVLVGIKESGLAARMKFHYVSIEEGGVVERDDLHCFDSSSVVE